MSGSNAHANDSMIRRLETELGEKETFANSIIERAQASERDLSEDDKKMLVETRERMENIKEQIENLESVHRTAASIRTRARDVDREISNSRSEYQRGPVEYRSAGAYTLDLYNAAMGKRDAKERLQVFERQSVDNEHMTTEANEGILPIQ